MTALNLVYTAVFHVSRQLVIMISIFESCARRQLQFVDLITSYQSINISRHQTLSLSFPTTTTITYTNDGHRLVNARSHAAASAHEDRRKC
jgi:hypothetical protein